VNGLRYEAGFFDADGVLITGGDLKSTPGELVELIREARSQGFKFNLASARRRGEQEELFTTITGDTTLADGEGILYEGAGLLMSDGSVYQTGGLTPEQLVEVKGFLTANPNLLKGMVPQANDGLYETTTGYVTPGFIEKGVTDKVLLETRYRQVVDTISKRFDYLLAEMSADAIDFVAYNARKDGPLRKYLEITGIDKTKTAVFGDSGSDIPMMLEVNKEGGEGLCVYVGGNKKHKAMLRNLPSMTKEQGPQGAIGGMHHINNFNKKTLRGK
jgi:hydroxymethylpyrimidine pyrophosphatase-like HAD family hydrolase